MNFAARQAAGVARPLPHRMLPAAAVLLGALAFAVMIGLAASLGQILILAVLVMPLALLAIGLLPAALLLWGTFALAFVVVGPAVYFVKVDGARWLVPALGLALLLPLVLRLAGRGVMQSPVSMPAFVWVLLLFLAGGVFSTLINGAGAGVLINATRSYLTIVGPMLLLGLGVLTASSLGTVWRFLAWVAVLQLPVGLIQFAFFRVKTTAAWDAVVGTFPGEADGGGASAGMGVFLVTMSVFAVALWRRGLLQLRWVVLAGLSTTMMLGLAEVKAAVLMIPVAIGLLYARELLRRPWQTLVALLIGLAVTGALLYGYSRVHYASAASSLDARERPMTPIEAIGNQLNPERITWNGTPSRMAAFRDWGERVLINGDWQHALFGHGMASTLSTRLGRGDLVGRYGYALDQTSTGVLLWEVGLVGHGLLALALSLAAWRAHRLWRDPRMPVLHQALMHAASVAIVLQLISLPYKSFAIKTAPSQMLLALLLGFVIFWHRELQRRPSLPGSAASSWR